jgi:peptidyl-prolyl cis-trans isomerase SurA
LNKDEAQKFYDEHKSEMEQPEYIRLSEILVAPKSVTPSITPAPEPGAAGSAPAGQPPVDDAAKQAAAAAAALSAAEAKAIEDETFAMKAGDVTSVIHNKQGYVILKVVDHQQAGIPPMKDILPLSALPNPPENLCPIGS